MQLRQFLYGLKEAIRMLRNLVRLNPILLFPVLAYLWQRRVEAFVANRPVGQVVTRGGHQTNFLSSSIKYPTVSSIYSYEIRPLYSHPQGQQLKLKTAVKDVDANKFK